MTNSKFSARGGTPSRVALDRPSFARSPSRRVNARAFDRHAKAPPLWEALPGGRARLEALCADWGLPALGRAKLFATLDSDPVSHLRATPRSSVVHVPSAKNQRIFSAASRTVEYPCWHHLEYDPDVLLFLHQPMKVDIQIVDSYGRKRGRERGRKRTVPYTPDWFWWFASTGYTSTSASPSTGFASRAPSRMPATSMTSTPRRGVIRRRRRSFAKVRFCTHHVFHSNDVNPQWLRNIRFPGRLHRTLRLLRASTRPVTLSGARCCAHVRQGVCDAPDVPRDVVLAHCLGRCRLRSRA